MERVITLLVRLWPKRYRARVSVLFVPARGKRISGFLEGSTDFLERCVLRRVVNDLERRKQIRFALRAPVHFRWKDRDGIVHKGQGFTRDISSQGAYIFAESQPPLETKIHIDVLFSSLLEARSPVQMSAGAKVIRVEPISIDERTGGFVAVSSSFTLLNAVTDLPR
jgi:hypothetical protein